MPTHACIAQRKTPPTVDVIKNILLSKTRRKYGENIILMQFIINTMMLIIKFEFIVENKKQKKLANRTQKLKGQNRSIYIRSKEMVTTMTEHNITGFSILMIISTLNFEQFQ